MGRRNEGNRAGYLMEDAGDEKQGLSMEQRQALSSFWSGSLRWDAPMAGYCTMKAGGRAGAVAVASGRAELAELIGWLEQQGVRWRVIGRGSNILVRDQGYDGVLVVLGGDFCSIDPAPPTVSDRDVTVVRFGAGCSVAKCIGWSVQQSLTGLEFMAGIPGSIGGAVLMNAGAWGHEIGDIVETVFFVDRNGLYHAVPVSDLEFSYRRMEPKDRLLKGAIVVGAVVALQPGTQRRIIETCREYAAVRKEKQPAGIGSAGSVFKNPPGDSAGRLIEAVGLKGLSRGEAMVSPKHANFIVNTGSASADDILDLIGEIQEKVFQASGIRLEPEVHIL